MGYGRSWQRANGDYFSGIWQSIAQGIFEGIGRSAPVIPNEDSPGVFPQAESNADPAEKFLANQFSAERPTYAVRPKNLPSFQFGWTLRRAAEKISGKVAMRRPAVRQKFFRRRIGLLLAGLGC
jgi:hypothetical protein